MKYVAVCTALYDYDAQAAEEVSIKENDILYVVDNSDPSWLEVQLKMPSVDQIGPIGLVPASYVEEVLSRPAVGFSSLTFVNVDISVVIC